MTAADLLRAEARDYRTRAIAVEDAGDDEGARALKIVAVVLTETAEALEHEFEEAA